MAAKRKAAKAAPAAPPPEEAKEEVAAKRKPASAAPSIEVPSVWREAGFLLLAYEISPRGLVKYFSTRDGEHTASSVQDFAAIGACRMESVNPYHLALNLLARLRVGVCQMRAKTERIFAAMLNVEQLEKMSERQLADEYKRIMGDGPARIKGKDREERIKEMLAKLSADAAANTETPATDAPSTDEAASAADGEAQPEGATEDDKTMSTTGKKGKTKGKTAAKKAAPAKKAPAKKAAAKKPATNGAARPTPTVPKDGSNPFREGTMKAKAFDWYLKHQGDRPGNLKRMVEQGATEATAASWYSVFNRIAPAPAA